MESSRREILVAIAIAPAVIAAPAIEKTNRHAAWLIERNRIADYINTTDAASLSEADVDDAMDSMVLIERRIMATPAASISESRAKLAYALKLYDEGACLPHDDAAMLFVELSRWFGGEA